MKTTPVRITALICVWVVAGILTGCNKNDSKGWSFSKQDVSKLAKAFEGVKPGMTQAEIETAVGAPGRLQTNSCDLKVGEVTGVTIENGEVTGTWSGSEMEKKIVEKITLGMHESDARRLLGGRPLSQCGIYRWGPDEHPFDVSFANGKAFRVSCSQVSSNP